MKPPAKLSACAVVVLICSLLASIYALFIVDSFRGAVPYHVLKTLRPGMTKTQVASVVGQIPSIGPQGDWAFFRGSHGTYVFFDADGRFLNYKEEDF
jgi:outer membrane protein assembly factor BamE (lipoprotein component of BamABCDE complex)